MSRKKEKPEEGSKASEVILGPPDADKLALVAAKIRAGGFLPEEAIRAEFGDEVCTRFVALFFSNHRAVRQVRRSWQEGAEKLGYEWADGRFSQQRLAKMPPWMRGVVMELGGATPPRYTDFQNICVRCRYTKPILGGQPVGEGGDLVNSFDKDGTGAVLILGYNQRAMASDALPLIGKSASLARHIRWSTIVFPNPTIKVTKRPVIDQRDQGRGLVPHEMMPEGREFVIDAMVPTSELSAADFLRMLAIRGKYVRLSPARSAGFGDFEVIGEA